MTSTPPPPSDGGGALATSPAHTGFLLPRAEAEARAATSDDGGDGAGGGGAVAAPAAVEERVALITGITGQDGSYLTEFLLKMRSPRYTVHGIIRRSSSFNTGRLHHLYKDPHEGPRLLLHYGDMADATNLMSIVNKVQPDEVYNLAAQSHVRVSFEMPEYTAEVDALGVLRMLDAIRAAGLADRCRFYQASTSELYGLIQEKVQSETTPFYPRSPYAVAKQFAYWIVINYREAYKMHASNGILFNHESPRRGPTFVTRKITRAVAAIHLGMQEILWLGNLDAERDWGHARDYVDGMWRMVQRDEPGDYVLATSEKHSVREFCELAFSRIGVTLSWRGSGLDEVGVAELGADDDGGAATADAPAAAAAAAASATATSASGDTADAAAGAGAGGGASGASKENKKRQRIVISDDDGKRYVVRVKIDPRYFRPTEVEELCGDYGKAKRELGWSPATPFAKLVEEMVDSDIQTMRSGDHN